MFERLKNVFRPASPENDNAAYIERLKAMINALDEPEYVSHDTDAEHQIDIYAFGRNFVEECDEDAEDDEGYVLITSGMSDRLMHASDNPDEETLAIELIWYVRDLNPEYFSNLRWLAKFPFIDNTWLGHGHTVPMPNPPLTFCPHKTFLFIPPTIRTDSELFVDIEFQDHAVGTLVVHLISDAEYALVKTNDGLNEFLDLLDQTNHPTIFNPMRESYVE